MNTSSRDTYWLANHHGRQHHEFSCARVYGRQFSTRSKSFRSFSTALPPPALPLRSPRWFDGCGVSIIASDICMAVSAYSDWMQRSVKIQAPITHFPLRYLSRLHTCNSIAKVYSSRSYDCLLDCRCHLRHNARWWISGLTFSDLPRRAVCLLRRCVDGWGLNGNLTQCLRAIGIG